MTEVMHCMMTWDDARRWRIRKRTELVARRRAVQRPLKDRVRTTVIDGIVKIIDAEGSAPRVIGGYWPIKGEIDLMPLMRLLAAQNHDTALPVIVEKESPVEFWRWRPNSSMTRGVWDIPVPSERDPVVPDILLVPLVGYDDECFRLGNGGGYYDRTLAAMDQKPLCIGVGYACTRQQTIFPQDHDIPMDVIVTEEGSFRQSTVKTNDEPGSDGIDGLASSPCSMDRAAPEYFGFLNATESLELILSLRCSIHESAGNTMEVMLFGRKAQHAKSYLDLVYMDIHACTILRRAADRLVENANGNGTIAALADAPVSSAETPTHDNLIDSRHRLSETIRTALPKISNLHLYEDLAKILRLQERALQNLAAPKENTRHTPAEMKHAG